VNRLQLSRSILNGTVRVSGAKNSVLRLLAASLLSDEDVVLENFPSQLLDVQIHNEMLELIGKRLERPTNSSLAIRDSGSVSSSFDWGKRSIRNTLLILGAMVARTGRGEVPLPGGCQLGERSFDLHQMLLEALGATVWVEGGKLCAEASAGLTGADIRLPIRSTGATENGIIAGCLAKGTTTIWNPHIRPEILDLVRFVNGMGGDVRVFGQERIEVRRIEQFRPVTHRIIPDNMEAITWLVAAVMTGGEVEILDFPMADLEVALCHLRGSGAKFYSRDDAIIVKGGTCYPIEVSTGPHPGINSDVQPLLAAYGLAAKGVSKIVDLRFPGRYAYAMEMEKMGGVCRVDGNQLVVVGQGGQLTGAHVTALDLRAGAALMACGLIASGETVIDDAWQIERGYEHLPQKLRDLGAAIQVA
jgi:UDP-N-acetylglucosamine 1-carboxyvinyltransferase